jgi:NAD(P)-dependent dehydrogenase (short-subunit alcohol dehydrogenase family)
MRVDGKIIAMTGAGRGIAEALAERFVIEGARHVVLSDTDAANVAKVAERLGQPWRRCDVSDAVDYDSYLAWIEDDIGPIDLCCNHPALHGGQVGGNLETSDDILNRAWAVNVMPHIRSARFLVPRMLERGGGYFLQTITAGALLTLSSPMAYSTSKYATLGFAEWLSLNYRDRNIGVSCICPSLVDTRPGAVGQPGVALSTVEVAAATIGGLDEERFLILPNERVGQSFARKGNDYDAWLAHTASRIARSKPPGPWDDRFPPVLPGDH